MVIHDCIFQIFDRTSINMSFLSTTKTFKRIIHRRGSTSGAPPLTKAPLYGVCRVKTSKFFLNRDPPQNMHNGHINVQICVKWHINAQSFSLGVGHAGNHFGLLSPFEMNIHKKSRGWNQIWKSYAPLHVRGLETPVLCDMMWWVVNDMVAYSTWREHVH